MRTPSARFGKPEQLDQIALGLEVVEQLADALEVVHGRDVLQQVGLAAHDQALAIVRASRTIRPSPASMTFCVSSSSSASAVASCFSMCALASVNGEAADVRIEIVGGLGQRWTAAARPAASMMRFSTLLSSPTRTTSALPGSSGTNSMCFRRAHLLVGEHHAGAVRQAGDHLAGLAAAPARSTSARLIAQSAPRSGGAPRGEVADLEQAVDEQAQADLGRQAPGRCVRGKDQAEMLQVRHDVADRGRRQRHRQQARQIARADRLAGREVGLDDRAARWCASAR